MRRYLATRLREIILRLITAAALVKAMENRPWEDGISRVLKETVGETG